MDKRKAHTLCAAVALLVFAALLAMDVWLVIQGRGLREQLELRSTETDNRIAFFRDHVDNQHSRLLERSSRLTPEMGGGSITALPIIETQAGDVSAYIPTNVISITDGQIFLETALFNAGNRPAVNVGLSVSRVGGAAQTKAMKKANANLRIELAQYKDMESFSQFSSDLDAETRRQLEHGKALMELLKQPLYQPKSDAEQVVLLTLAAHGVLDEIKTGELRQKTSAFVRQFRTDPSGVMDEIQASGKLSPEQVQTILNAWNAFAGGDAHAIH